jgi:hypothetical protein
MQQRVGEKCRLASCRRGDSVVAIEVKSGRRKGTLPGMQTFSEAYGGATCLLVGGQGMPIEEFFRTPVPALVT